MPFMRFYSIENPYPESVIILSYLGHDMCYTYLNSNLQYEHQYNSEAEEPTTGQALYITSCAAIADHRGTDWEAVTTVHEIGHLFMVEDHYANNVILKPNQNPACIYGSYKDDYSDVESIVICQYCDSTIRSHISKYGAN